MLAVKAQFDGQKVVLPQKLHMPPCPIIVIFESGVGENGSDQHAWLKAQESAFSRVWENDEDAVYDTL